ncbi:MAG: glycosyltransferase family 1 protein [Candidatus Buchananbacteria bacterium]
MKIGIDCRTMLNPAGGELAGVGHYTYNLVKNLLLQDKQNQYVLFFDFGFTDLNYFQSAKVKIVRYPLSRYRRYLPFFYSQFLVGEFINRQKVDVCLFPANIIPFSYRGRAVVTVHDLAVYLYPELFPDRLINFDRRYLVPRSLRRADRIIAVSENTKRDIIKLFHIATDRIEVIYEGVELTCHPEQSEGSQGETGDSLLRFHSTQNNNNHEKYLLYLGTIEPRKNLVRLIKAFKKLKQEEPAARDLKLFLAGKNGWKNEEVFAALEQVNTELQEEAIRYLGYVSAGKKHELLSRAEVFVFPSLYEGFGLPVAEAMAYGLPVITSGAGSLPEVGGEAVFYIDPLKESELYEALRKVITDESFRQHLALAAKQKSQEFTWDKCARQTRELLEGL